jgi:hypothetical protein
MTDTTLPSIRPKIIPFRKPESVGPSDDQWAQAKARASAWGMKFGSLICEDGDGVIFVAPINVESDVHLRAMVEAAPNVFAEDSDD